MSQLVPALPNGRRPPRPGTARAALGHQRFRRIWLGSFASNVGTWMQTVVLGAYAYDLTGSSGFVGILTFAQLGPLLLLSIPGGVVADAVDRRRWLIGCQTAQLVFVALLAVLVTGTPSRLALGACVLAVGIGNALNAPAWGAALPTLVGPEDLPGAIALNSTMINGSRVIGPALGGLLFPILGAAWVFTLNAVSFLFVIAALVSVRFPPGPARHEEGVRARLVGGFRAARDNPVVARILMTMALFSFFCLPFVGLFPAIAERQLGLESDSLGYGLLYATFGLGACLGALAVGTVLAERLKAGLVRPGLVAFGTSLGVLALVRQPAPAFVVLFVVGALYFGTTTAMLTVLVSTLDDAVRGRVMALWFMAFGGTVPLGALAFGPLLDATSAALVLGVGAVVAVALGWWCDLRWVGKLAMIELV